MKRYAAVGAGVLALLAFASSAEAAKFCVQKPKCVQQGGTEAASVQAAFNLAAANGSNRDRVELGGKEFDNGPFSAAPGNPVNVVGAGASKTTLTRLATTDNVVILTLGDEDSKVSDLRVLINDGNNVRGIQTSGTARDLRVVSKSMSTSQSGVLLGPGGRLVESRVSLPRDAPGSAALLMQGDQTLARDSRLQGSVGISGGALMGGTMRGVRLAIDAQSLGFNLFAGKGVLDQATIRLRTTGGGAAVQVNPSTGDATLTARHVTAVGTGQPGTVGAGASATGVAGDCPTAKLVLRNSVLRKFDNDLRRSGLALMCTGPLKTVINVAWSVFDPAKVFEAGDGKVQKGKGNRNVNPQFVKQAAGNYHLKSSSPVIDKGEPGKPGKGHSKTDLDGRKRVLDGDGDGKARRDIGAFERPG